VLEVVRERPVDPAPRCDPVGADHARVAHVDHVRVGHVERHPEADQEQDAQREGRRGQDGHQPLSPLARAKPHPGHPREEVDQHRIHQRHRPEDLPLVEEDVGDAEAEQHQQVEVEQPEWPPRIEEGDQEDHAQGQPDVGGVELPPECALVAAGHLPGHLGAAPGLDHPAGVVLDLDLGQLVVVREEADLPATRAIRVGVGLEVGMLGALLPRGLGPARDPGRLA
jgi:hypothetical protein